MNATEIILLALLLSSILINIFLFIHQKRFKSIFNKVLDEMQQLQKLLSGSTTNLDKLLQENKSLWNQVQTLKKNKENLLTVNQGDKVVIKQSLTDKKSSHTFEVLYECNVLEATESKLKLSAYDFKSEDDWANKNKKSVIDFFQDRWENRNECEMIMDQQHLRDSKLNDLLNGIEDSN